MVFVCVCVCGNIINYYVLCDLQYFLLLSAIKFLVLDIFVGLIPEPEVVDDNESKELKSLYHTGYKWRKNNIFYDDY